MNSLAKSTDTNDTYRFYAEVPKRAVSYNFIICFFLYAIILICQIVFISTSKSLKTLVPKPKLKRYVNIMIPFIIGCFLESIGFIGRLLSADNMTSMGLYILQACAILIAPTLFAATAYMYFGELIKTLKIHKLSIIDPKYLTKIFVGGDIVSFLLQGNGAGLFVSSNKTLVLVGRIMVIAGLVVNILFFGLFCVTQVIVYYRIYRSTNKVCMTGSQFPSRITNWKTCGGILSFVSIMIMVRSVYRVVEYVQGNNGSITRNQELLYLLDSTMMSCAGSAFSLFNVPYFFMVFENRFGEVTDDLDEIVQLSDSKDQAANIPLVDQEIGA
ncbi:RTA1 like protein-domain-containing protein [Scheffersomyces coipomensis]|uniref:RTA1 like protein-domain-containing protein n=1 Tax=Scheffersomyces coipomensis TaxID=1788519 RepID=UPI00315CBCEE